MRFYYNLFSIILASSFEGITGQIKFDQAKLNEYQLITQQKSFHLKRCVAGVEIKPVAVNSKVGPIPGAKFMFDTVGLAYCPSQKIIDYNGEYSRRLSNKFNPLKVITNKEYETQAFIGSYSVRKEMMVVFRGIANDKNFKMVLNTDQVPFNNQKDVLVHSGSNTILNAIESDLLNYLIPLFNEEQYKNYTIVFAGHSLGGSVATLAAAKLSPKLNLPWKRVHLFTYGSPRVGNKQFANWFNSKPLDSTRVVNNNDPVPKFPKNNYVHIHHEVFIKGQETITCNTTSFEDPNCSQSLPDSFNFNPHLSAWDKSLSKDDC